MWMLTGAKCHVDGVQKTLCEQRQVMAVWDILDELYLTRLQCRLHAAPFKNDGAAVEKAHQIANTF